MSQLTARFSLVAAAATMSLLLGACDETPSLDDPGSSHRKNFTLKYAAPPSTKLTADIIPWDGSGPLPDLTPEDEFALQSVIRNADAVATASHAESFLAGMKCPALCDSADSGWTGEVAVVGAYEMGEVELVEFEDGMHWQADVYADFELQCVCEG